MIVTRNARSVSFGALYVFNPLLTLPFSPKTITIRAFEYYHLLAGVWLFLSIFHLLIRLALHSLEYLLMSVEHALRPHGLINHGLLLGPVMLLVLFPQLLGLVVGHLLGIPVFRCWTMDDWRVVPLTKLHPPVGHQIRAVGLVCIVSLKRLVGSCASIVMQTCL